MPDKKKPKKPTSPVKKPEKPVKPGKEKKPEKTGTEIVCVVDKSGSMGSIKDDAIGGFNNFLDEQKKLPGKAALTLVLFDTHYTIVCSGKPIAQVDPLNDHTFRPSGSTALLDATGRAINELNQRNPEKAIIMILTDGQENSSTEFNKLQIRQMIDDCEKKGWAVIYLSADANAFADGKSLGLGTGQIMSFKADQRGAHVSTMAASFATADYRRSGICGQMASYSARAQQSYDNNPGVGAFPGMTQNPVVHKPGEINFGGIKRNPRLHTSRIH